MPFDVPLSSHARTVDIAARALARGDSPQAVAHRLWEVGAVPTPEDAATFIAEARRSQNLMEMINSGLLGAAEAAFGGGNVLPSPGGEVIQAVATITGPQGTAERPIRINIPAGATLEEVLALVSASAETIAEMGAGNDTPGGGVVASIRYMGLYQQ